MAFLMLMKWDGVKPDEYDKVIEELGLDDEHADGGLLHFAGLDDSGLRVVDVWESPEHFERFGQERLMPAVQRAGVEGEPEVTLVELHNVHSPRGEEVLAMDSGATAR
jgi:hypothetical protein